MRWCRVGPAKKHGNGIHLIQIFAIPMLLTAVVLSDMPSMRPEVPRALAAELQRPAEQASDCSNPSTFLSALAISLNSYLIFNFSPNCTAQVGAASYIIPSGNPLDLDITSQILFDSSTASIAPGQIITLSVVLPPCTFQTDAFWGPVVSPPLYDGRLLGFTRDGLGACTPTPTSTV